MDAKLVAMRSLLLMFFLCVFLNSCDYNDHRLWIEKDTNQSISFSTDQDTIPQLSNVNPTEYHFTNAVSPGESENFVKPGSTKGWSYFIANSKNERLNLFVYDIDSLKKYQSIDTLIRRQIYTRHSFTEQELDKMDWKIVIEN